MRVVGPQPLPGVNILTKKPNLTGLRGESPQTTMAWPLELDAIWAPPKVSPGTFSRRTVGSDHCKGVNANKTGMLAKAAAIGTEVLTRTSRSAGKTFAADNGS